MLSQNGLVMRQAGVESPERIGRVERHGGLWKNVCKRIITHRGVAGTEDMRVALAEATNAKNALSRSGGFSPAQWAFGILPRGA